jgi:hypothetical protein
VTAWSCVRLVWASPVDRRRTLVSHLTESSAGFARASTRVQAELDRWNAVLSVRDAFVAVTVAPLNECLTVSNDDFDVAGLESLIGVRFPYRNDATEQRSVPEEPDSE